MRKAFRFAALLAGILAVSVPGRAGEGTYVLYPPDLVLTTESTIRVHAFRPGGKAPVPVTLNGMEREPLEGENFLSGKISLTFGLNLLDIDGKRIRIYSLPGSKMEQYKESSGSEGNPALFRSYRLHPALEDGCEGCHMVKDGKLGMIAQREACSSCHDDFEKGGGSGGKWYVHGPVADGECTACHDPHYADQPKLLKKDKICFDCHDPFRGEGTVHQPVKDGECAACHSPHAGPVPKQLLRAGNALCLGCHENPHNQHRSASVMGTLTAIPSDFPVEKGQLACLGCHRPHESDERRLFRMNQGEMCQTCHKV